MQQLVPCPNFVVSNGNYKSAFREPPKGTCYFLEKASRPGATRGCQSRLMVWELRMSRAGKIIFKDFESPSLAVNSQGLECSSFVGRL